MLRPGLVSITFRNLTYLEIIKLVKKSKLKAIEWGGDVHVPHNDHKKAKEVRKLMDKEGLITSSYGSYYRVGVSNPDEFCDIIKTAQILNTSTIRVWAGVLKSNEANNNDWQNVISDAIRIAKLAKEEKIDIAFEYHDNTLTDTIDSALQLIKEINQPNVYLYWQPPVGMSEENCLSDLKHVIPYLKNIHVFEWDKHTRLPLIKGFNKWKKYLALIPKHQIHYCLLEFVKDDSIDQFYQDSKVLKELVK